MRQGRDGILVVNKPAGISSAKVVALVKRITGCAKVGHAGSLDPFATGVLICCLNRATKLAQFLITGHKRYHGVIRLGIETDTLDRTGTVTRVDRTLPETDQIDPVFERFKGMIWQQPPVYSALKHKGVPLYKLARKGRPVTKPKRRIQVSTLAPTRVDLPRIGFEVECSAGTYVRVLAADIGKALGCGGHLDQLQRLACSGFRIEDALTLSDLESLVADGGLGNRLIAMADALQDMPEYRADKVLTRKIKYGTMIGAADGPRLTTPYLKIVGRQRRLLAVVGPGRDRHAAYRYYCVFPDN